jgi:hypothetical protein
MHATVNVSLPRALRAIRYPSTRNLGAEQLVNSPWIRRSFDGLRTAAWEDNRQVKRGARGHAQNDRFSLWHPRW